MKQGISLITWMSVITLVAVGLLAQELSAPGNSSHMLDSATPVLGPDQLHVANISDATAYRLFFLMIAKRPNADPSFDLRRRTAYLQHYFPRQLTAEQIRHLLSAADALSINFAFPAGAGSGTRAHAEMRALEQKQHQAITNALNSLALSDPDAAAKVRAHVLTHVKAVIRANRPMPNP